jgi:catechol 2,3-dioxygenase-like lactoylglutathione lyase family enzyme
MSTTLAVIELTVADMGRSLAFYRGLGLDIAAEADNQPHAEVTLPGGLRLLWDTVDNIKSFDPDWVPPQGGTRMALGFECDSPADVDETYAQLVDAGYEGHKQPWDAVWGMRYAMIRDPDGNGVDLFAALPT